MRKASRSWQRRSSADRSRGLGALLVTGAALAAYGGCSNRPDGVIIDATDTGGATGRGGASSGGASGTGTGGSAKGGSVAAGGASQGGSAGTPAGGAAGTATSGGAAGTTTSGGVAGTATSGGATSGGSAGSPIVNDASCSMGPPPRADVIQENHPDATTIFNQMSADQRLDILSGPNDCPSFNCFDTLAVPPDYVDFRMRDGPRGVRGVNGERSTAFAVAEARAASWDLELEYRVGEAIAAELRALRTDIMLAPTVNVLRHPGWARAQETYGEDPMLIGEMGAAFVRGMQEGATPMPACPKHFAGNNTDENRGGGDDSALRVNVTVDEQTLRENYTRAFQIIVEKSDPACIMAAYNDVNGQTCVENTHLLQEILRDDWGWTGFVVSDWWATIGPSRGEASISAGLDVEMPTNDAFQGLGSGQSALIDRAARRVLDVRASFGQLTQAYRDHHGQSADPSIVDNHVGLAQETEEKGAVLLKNENVLPLGAAATAAGMGTASVTSIVVLGPDREVPRADTSTGAHGLGDRGSSNNAPPHAVSFLTGLTTRATGIEVTGSADASAAVGKTIAVIPVTMAHEDEGEAYSGGGDRDTLTISGTEPRHWGDTKPAQFIQQVRDADANVKIVVLLAVGSAVIMEDWIDDADAIVQTFYPGQEGGTAVARLLFGDVNFSGKLPFTVAIDPAHYPEFGNTVGQLTFEYLHGYRRFEANGNAPRFPFGFGLSYTSYEYSNLQVLCPEGVGADNSLSVAVTVRNAGTVAGDEVVQLYVRYPETGKRRPPKELKGFTKVHLEAGASQEVRLTVPVRDLQHWGDAGWELDLGEHTVLVGASSAADDLLAAPFTIR